MDWTRLRCDHPGCDYVAIDLSPRVARIKLREHEEFDHVEEDECESS